MRYFLIIIAFVTFFLSATAQEVQPCCDQEINEAFEPKLNGEIYQPLSDIVGEEFFNLHYVNGDIILHNKEIVTNKLIRYNGRIDGLLFKAPNGQEILLDKYFINGFCLKEYMGKPEIYFKKIKVIRPFLNDTTEVFGELLYQNRLSLYAFRQYIFDKEVIQHINNHLIYRNSYAPSPIYYFQLPNYRTIGFKSFKKKDLYKIFPDNKNLMRKLFREKHQRRFKNEEDLVRITEILNSMIN